MELTELQLSSAEDLKKAAEASKAALDGEIEQATKRGDEISVQASSFLLLLFFCADICSESITRASLSECITQFTNGNMARRGSEAS